MRIAWIIFCQLWCSISFAQCVTFQLTKKGDTLNCTDKNKLKQGKWMIHVDELRGNPGYEEEGVFENNLKIGVWRKYSLMGDLLAIENYKWGMQDGVQQYYSIAGLIREESWKAIDPEKKFDTVEVPDPLDQGKVEMKVVKVEGNSLEHGVWRYFDPGSGALLKQETYVLGKPYVKNNVLGAERSEYRGGKNADQNANDSLPQKEKPKPKAVEEWEKKNKGKKHTVREGRTG